MKSGNPIKIIPGSVPMCIKALYKQCHLWIWNPIRKNICYGI